MRTAILLVLQVPIFMPSAEQTDCPEVVQGMEPAAALLPVEPDEAEPEEEAVPVAAGTAGLGVPIADPVAIGIIDGAALDLAAPGAPGGGTATMDMEGEAAPEGEEEPEPISEPSPVTVGIPELPAEPLGAESDGPEGVEAPSLPEPELAALALPQSPDIPVFEASEPAIFLTDSPGFGKIGSVPSTVAQPLLTEPILALNRSGYVLSRLKISSELYSWVMLTDASSICRFFEPPVIVTGAHYIQIEVSFQIQRVLLGRKWGDKGEKLAYILIHLPIPNAVKPGPR